MSARVFPAGRLGESETGFGVGMTSVKYYKLVQEGSTRYLPEQSVRRKRDWPRMAIFDMAARNLVAIRFWLSKWYM